jgi:hypothetical protein
VDERTPGPTPWYLPTVDGYRWSTTAEDMVCVLSRTEGFIDQPQAVLILNGYSYVQVLNSTTLVVWRQLYVAQGNSAPVVIRVFRLGELTGLGEDVVTRAAALRYTHSTFSLSTTVSAECDLDTTTVESSSAQFPEILGGIDELLVLCQCSAIKERSDLGLMVVQPKKSSYQIYPQDWFNKGGFDYGYESVTRVARNARTRFIEGEGMRIEPFVLDQTLDT